MVWGLPTSSGFQPALPTASRMRTKPCELRVFAQEVSVPIEDELPRELIGALVGHAPASPLRRD